LPNKVDCRHRNLGIGVMFDLSTLNEQQRIAATTIEGPVLILAGAGSGKTKTITFRIAHMIRNEQIAPSKILAVSFTNKSATEMRERVCALLTSAETKGMMLSTFHALGLSILKREIHHLNRNKNFTIYDSNDQLSVIKEGLKTFKDEKSAFDAKTIHSKIGRLKNAGLSEHEWVNSNHFDHEDPYDRATHHCYLYYQEKLKFFNAIDFDDILFLTVKLFESFEDLALKYSRQYQYIMIDEYQDTNTLQFKMVQALTKTHHNICVVGDDDQSIYGFRGADVSNILSFEKSYPKAKIIKLEQNYRSTTPILNLANEVIRTNEKRRDKKLWSSKKSETLPILWKTANTDHEAQIVIEEIVKHQRAGNRLSDIAILYRSKTQAPPFEEQLRLSQLPYKIVGGQKFYDKQEVKDIIAYLCLIDNQFDEISLRRILNVPNRGIGMATLEKYLKKSEELKLSVFLCMEKFPALDPAKRDLIASFCALIRKYQNAFSKYSLENGISSLIEEINFNAFIEKRHADMPKQVEKRKRDVALFIDGAARFTRFAGEYATLKNYIEKVLLADSQDTEEEEESAGPKNEVTMMTLHSSKGLEFPFVFLVGIEEDLLPHKKSISENTPVSEERRLAYVGITRAREKLVMTYCKEREIYGKNLPRHPSRFLKEIPEKIAPSLYKEQDTMSFGHLSPQDAESYKKSFFSDLLKDL